MSGNTAKFRLLGYYTRRSNVIYSIKTSTIIQKKCSHRPYRWAIHLEDERKFHSSPTYYFLICSDINIGYLIPLNIVLNHAQDFKGDGIAFPLRIDPNTDRTVYYENRVDIRDYRIELASDHKGE